jgi:hypothetical protein
MTLPAVDAVKGPIAGLGIELSTLSRLNENKPLAAKPVLMFFSCECLYSLRAKERSKMLLANRVNASPL